MKFLYDDKINGSLLKFTMIRNIIFFSVGQQWWQDKVKAEEEAKKAEEVKKAPAPAAKGGPAKPAPAARGGGAAGRGAPASRGAPAARGRGAATTPARGLCTTCLYLPIYKYGKSILWDHQILYKIRLVHEPIH